MNRSIVVGAGIAVVVAGALSGCSMDKTAQAGAAAAATTQDGTVTASEAPASVAPAQADASGAPSSPDASSTSTVASAPAAAHSSAARQPTASSTALRTPLVEPASPNFAKVVSSEPIIETERVAREECHDEQVTQQKPVKDEKRVAGAALGAVLGGVLGHQVGDGDGRKIATIAGAVAGGYAGSKVQKRVQEGNTEVVTQKVCKTVYDTHEKRVGYRVTYSVGGEVHTLKMDVDPGVGASLPLRNGQPVLSSAPVAPARALRSAS
jgi:uncharacterized protein YcfJ